MLIRQCYTRSESIKPPFDEVQNRTTRNLQYGGWAEYMVAWRKDRVEIYEDHVRFLISWCSVLTRLPEELTGQGMDDRS